MFRGVRAYRCTLAIAVAAVASWALPTLASDWTLHFERLADGQWWRLWTGHCTHYDTSHLFWDLLMFVVLGAACERRHQGTFAAVLAAMMGTLGFAIWLWCPDVTQYRGLSGLDTGLFVWFVSDRIRDSWQACEPLVSGAWLALCIGLIGKLLFEATTGQTLFVDSTNFQPLVESHLAGAVCGLAFGLGVHCLRNWKMTITLVNGQPSQV